MNVLIIGNSDGIGLALTRLLLAEGGGVVSLSRSALPENLAGRVEHVVLDVTDGSFPERLGALYAEHGCTACVYCVGIGESLDPGELGDERRTFEVNLMGAVRALEAVVPHMRAAGSGHFVALSSLADVLVNPGAPSYSGSKAGLSSYLEGLALALRPQGVFITNVRFGFVDTKMAKAPTRPFMMTPERAAAHVRRCLDTRPVRLSRPRTMAALTVPLRWLQTARVWLRR